MTRYATPTSSWPTILTGSLPPFLADRSPEQLVQVAAGCILVALITSAIVSFVASALTLALDGITRTTRLMAAIELVTPQFLRRMALMSAGAVAALAAPAMTTAAGASGVPSADDPPTMHLIGPTDRSGDVGDTPDATTLPTSQTTTPDTSPTPTSTPLGDEESTVRRPTHSNLLPETPTAPLPGSIPPSVATPGDAFVATWQVAEGDCLWTIAETVQTRGFGRTPTPTETASYLERVIAANRANLRDADRPDLVYSGQVIVLPVW